MTGYIINPIWFYFLDVCEGLKIVVFILAGCLAVTAIIGFGMYACDEFYDDEKALKNLKKMIIATIILLVVAIIIPSKQTLITMMVAKFATYENAGWTVDAIKGAVDYIVEAIKSLG